MKKGPFCFAGSFSWIDLGYPSCYQLRGIGFLNLKKVGGIPMAHAKGKGWSSKFFQVARLVWGQWISTMFVCAIRHYSRHCLRWFWFSRRSLASLVIGLNSNKNMVMEWWSDGEKQCTHRAMPPMQTVQTCSWQCFGALNAWCGQTQFVNPWDLWKESFGSCSETFRFFDCATWAQIFFTRMSKWIPCHRFRGGLKAASDDQLELLVKHGGVIGHLKDLDFAPRWTMPSSLRGGVASDGLGWKGMGIGDSVVLTYQGWRWRWRLMK